MSQAPRPSPSDDTLSSDPAEAPAPASVDAPGPKGHGAAAIGPDKHIVDQLIEERAEGLIERPRVWALIKRFLYPALKYPEAIDIADRIGPLGARDVMETVSRDLRLDLDVKGQEHIPADGAFILVANHPTGIVDGLAVYDALKAVRPDMTFFANRDAIRVSPKLHEMIIPVEWVLEKRSRARTKETLLASAKAFRQGKAVVIFPSGGIAYPNWRLRLIERPWLTTTLSLARKHRVPVLPLNVRSRNSFIYYFFHAFSNELRNMTVFNEMLNKRGTTFRLRFGPAIAPEDLEGDVEAVTRALQDYTVHGLLRGKSWADYRP
jgi:putative hemolysin